jgi:HEAT repeat protein
MPLVKPASATLDLTARDSREVLLERLIGNDADDRRRAARALSREPNTQSILSERLECESERHVRDALFASLVEIGGIDVADLVARKLRSSDAGLRGGAVEALKSLADDAVPVLDELLGDPDADVRLLAIEVTRVWPAALALPRLRRVIENDQHVNVCAAAVDVATEVGTEELLAALTELHARFADEQFLTFAIDIARDRIRRDHARGA